MFQDKRKDGQSPQEDSMHEPITGSNLPPVMALAFLGDAEYSLRVRLMLVKDGIGKAGELNARALSYVTAEKQASFMRRIEPLLTEDERDVYRRARNNVHLRKPKHASPMDYREATGLEAVFGMLKFIKDDARLDALFDEIEKTAKEENDD